MTSTAQMNINYITSKISVTIDGPCPICNKPLLQGQLITLNPTTHRVCDPIATALDNILINDFDAIARNLP